MIGQSLGHYQILEKIGAGGMGDVYKARDTRLNRLVAIKVLAPSLADDAVRLLRFTQEAQAASALNHPNIVTIHDIGLHNGVDFLVMEHIDGKTLDALIPPQGMRLNEALEAAISIADGLAAAHRAGIIHRDIKPSNVMVAADGRVKVLDFGIAKLAGPSTTAPDDNLTLSERPHTLAGEILGTIAYMSPEQAEGKKVDARTDIFSFGALLYEMVTGRRAFGGGSKVATLSAILKEDPSWPLGTPTDLEQTLRRALHKDPAERFQKMEDLRAALEELKREYDSAGFTVPLVPPTPAIAATATHATAANAVRQTTSRWPALALLLVAAIGGLLFWQRQRPGVAATEYRLSPLTADSGLTTTPTLSPDGRLVAYASDRASQSDLDIWVQPLTQGAQSIRLTSDTAEDSSPVFSPDGGEIVFFSQREGGGLYLVPALGGQERLLAKGGREARFSPDGKFIAYSTGVDRLFDSKVFVIPTSGGVARQVAVDIPWATAPQWSPDGKWLLVEGTAGANQSETAEFWFVPVDGHPSQRSAIRKHLTANKVAPSGLDWRGDAILFVAGSEIWSLAIQPGTWQPGELRKLVAATGGLQHPHGSPARFVFASGMQHDHLWSMPMDHRTAQVKGPPRPLPHAGGNQTIPSMSQNGRLVYRQSRPGATEIRVRDGLDGKDRVVVSDNLRPEISPDGLHIAYSTWPDSLFGLFLVDTAGGQATELISAKEQLSSFDWTLDGQRILFWHGTPIRFSTINPRTRQRQLLIAHPTINIHMASLSPDEKWVAFILKDRESTLMVAPVRKGEAAPEAEWITVRGPPSHQARPWWSPDGNLLYFVSDRDRYGCIWAWRLHPVTRRPIGQPTAVLHLHETRRSTTMGSTKFGPTTSQDQLVFGLREQTANIWLAEPVPARP